jgi:hypothetical protein
MTEFDNSQIDAPFGKGSYITFKSYEIEIKKVVQLNYFHSFILTSS